MTYRRRHRWLRRLALGLAFATFAAPGGSGHGEARRRNRRLSLRGGGRLVGLGGPGDGHSALGRHRRGGGISQVIPYLSHGQTTASAQSQPVGEPFVAGVTDFPRSTVAPQAGAAGQRFGAAMVGRADDRDRSCPGRPRSGPRDRLPPAPHGRALAGKERDRSGAPRSPASRVYRRRWSPIHREREENCSFLRPAGQAGVDDGGGKSCFAEGLAGSAASQQGSLSQRSPLPRRPRSTRVATRRPPRR